MVENLTIRFFRDSIEWLFQDGEARVLSRGKGQLEDLAAVQQLDTPSIQVKGVLAGEQVLLTTVTVPAKPTRQIMQAVPYLVEERLACDVEDCFFAIGKRSGNELDIAVVNRAWFEGILSAVKAVNLSPEVMAVEPNLLASAEQSTIYIDANRAHLLFSDQKGLTTELDQLCQLVTLTSPELTETLRVVRFEDTASEADIVIDEIATLDTLSLVQETQPGSCLELMANTMQSATLDLLQGPYLVRKKQAGSGNWLKTVGWVALSVFIIQFCLMVAEGIYINEQAATLASDSESLYRSVYPDDRNISNMRRRWNSHLGQADTNDSAGFL
ncbi:MAG: hypothetical protein HOL98_14935, partial [Gammaproteobacteria bacterium]|nr:hypothetical protein [Gammaproteobacteria bacterium]